MFIVKNDALLVSFILTLLIIVPREKNMGNEAVSDFFH